VFVGQSTAHLVTKLVEPHIGHHSQQLATCRVGMGSELSGLFKLALVSLARATRNSRDPHLSSQHKRKSCVAMSVPDRLVSGVLRPAVIDIQEELRVWLFLVL
jgi:hypothetical protein